MVSASDAKALTYMFLECFNHITLKERDAIVVTLYLVSKYELWSVAGELDRHNPTAVLALIHMSELRKIAASLGYHIDSSDVNDLLYGAFLDLIPEVTRGHYEQIVDNIGEGIVLLSHSPEELNRLVEVRKTQWRREKLQWMLASLKKAKQHNINTKAEFRGWRSMFKLSRHSALRILGRRPMDYNGSTNFQFSTNDLLSDPEFRDSMERDLQGELDKLNQLIKTDGSDCPFCRGILCATPTMDQAILNVTVQETVSEPPAMKIGKWLQSSLRAFYGAIKYQVPSCIGSPPNNF